MKNIYLKPIVGPLKEKILIFKPLNIKSRLLINALTVSSDYLIESCKFCKKEIYIFILWGIEKIEKNYIIVVSKKNIKYNVRGKTLYLDKDFCSDVCSKEFKELKRDRVIKY